MELSKDYIRGFNSGYIIRKNHPLLMKNLVRGAKGNSQYLDGLKTGSNQYEKEMEVKLKQFNQQRAGSEKKKDREMGM